MRTRTISAVVAFLAVASALPVDEIVLEQPSETTTGLVETPFNLDTCLDQCPENDNGACAAKCNSHKQNTKKSHSSMSHPPPAVAAAAAKLAVRKAAKEHKNAVNEALQNPRWKISDCLKSCKKESPMICNTHCERVQKGYDKAMKNKQEGEEAMEKHKLASNKKQEAAEKAEAKKKAAQAAEQKKEKAYHAATALAHWAEEAAEKKKSCSRKSSSQG